MYIHINIHGPGDKKVPRANTHRITQFFSLTDSLGAFIRGVSWPHQLIISDFSQSSERDVVLPIGFLTVKGLHGNNVESHIM